MAVVLTCDCGARFEIDDPLASSEVNCPECGHQLPARRGASHVTGRRSWLALISVVLGLSWVGAIPALLLGLFAMIRIRRPGSRLQGSGYALAGIVLGLIGCALWLVVLRFPDRFPVGAWLRMRSMTAEVDLSGSANVSTQDGVCLLTRPPKEWPSIRPGGTADPAVEGLHEKRELILVQPSWHAFLDVYRENNPPPQLSAYETVLTTEITPRRKSLLGEEEEKTSATQSVRPPQWIGHKDLEPVDGYEGQEWIYDVLRGGQTWRFVIRVYHKPGGARTRQSPWYVLRVYAPRHQFSRHDEELRRVLDTVRFAP